MKKGGWYWRFHSTGTVRKVANQRSFWGVGMLRNKSFSHSLVVLMFVIGVAIASPPSTYGFGSPSEVQPDWWWSHHRVECGSWVYTDTEYTCKYVPNGSCVDINFFDCETRIRIDICTRHCVKYDEHGSIIEEYDEIDDRRYRDGSCENCILNDDPYVYFDDGLYHFKQNLVCLGSRH